MYDEIMDRIMAILIVKWTYRFYDGDMDHMSDESTLNAGNVIKSF